MSSPNEIPLQMEKDQIIQEIASIPRRLIFELVVTAMNELIQVAQLQEPMWIKDGNNIEVLNAEHYAQTFPNRSGSRRLGFRSEGSRDISVVVVNHTTLLNILMNVDHWTTAFSGIVGRAMTLQFLSNGVPAESFNGAMQLMTAEIQLPSPLVQTRESVFVRYSKKIRDSSTWAVVDVSLDHLLSNNTSRCRKRSSGCLTKEMENGLSKVNTTSRCRKRPSGCLIKEMENGHSKVLWVEHVEVSDIDVPVMYKTFINTSLAFGAKRWLANLGRHCERLASLMACNISTGHANVGANPRNGRKSMLLLAQRMMNSYRAGIGASTPNKWIIFPENTDDSERIMINIRSTDNPIGNPAPPGTVLNVATSLWLPVSPKRLSDFLRDGNSRSQWDILSQGCDIQEVAHISYSHNPANRVSFFRISSTNRMLLQESSTDETGSYIVSAPIDASEMNTIVSGGDPDSVAILPSGFAILPHGYEALEDGEIPKLGFGGSLLTVSFQLLTLVPTAAVLNEESVGTLRAFLACTVQKLKAAGHKMHEL